MNKALYYVDKYADALLIYVTNGNQAEIDRIIYELYMDLSNDVTEICEMRHSRTNNTFFWSIKRNQQQMECN